MTLRSVASLDRAHALKSTSLGVGEASTLVRSSGVTIAIMAAWNETPIDRRDPHGPAAAQFGSAVADILESDAADVVRSDRLTREATGITWDIEHIEPMPGVGFRLHLSQRGQDII